MGSDTVDVAAPTGEKNIDRASILAALDQVEPGGTVRFAPGTYLIGEIIHVTVPGITVVGHPDGTTLRGCHPDMFPRQGGMEEMFVAVVSCNGLDMAGGHQTVRGLTFEYAWHALVLGGMECMEGRGCVPVLQPVESRPGGYRVEDNTFRNTANGIRTLGQWSEPAVIRGNRFINTFHAVQVNGSIVHVVENEISVPEPERVPSGHPGGAMNVSATDLNSEAVLLCAGNVIAGNRISGHTDGIAIWLLRAGVSCRDNVIRDNTIAVERVKVPTSWWGLTPTESDSSAVGVPIALINAPKADPEVFGSAAIDEQEGMLEGNLIEGNVISGAAGIGIELIHASGNRIVNNTITGVARRDPFPGITVNSFDPQKSGWREANGSGIWVSPGSDENEILGNTFDDIASYVVFLEGDSNRIELRSASDSVRDGGAGNRAVRPRSDHGSASTHVSEDIPAELVARLDSLARAALEAGPVAGFSVAVLRGEDTLLLEGYGHADIALEVPASRDTRYRLVGPAATILAALVMKQVEAGRIALDDDVSHHLPDFPWQGRSVTVRQLLSATSGLPDYHYLGDPYWAEIAVPKTPDQVTALFAGLPFAHEPGERQQWTISGFHLAGLLLERLSGKQYGELIEEEIVRPLGLEQTGYCDGREIVPGVATGYEAAGSRVLPARPASPSIHPFTLSVCASAGDVAEVYQALRDGRLISSASYTDMTALSGPARDALESNGRAFVAGLVMDTLAGGLTFMFGGLEGFASHAIDVPGEDLTVVILTNALWAPGWSLAFNMTRASLGLPLSPEPPAPPQPELRDLPVTVGDAERYAGTYRTRLLDPHPPWRLYQRTHRIFGANDGLWIQPLGGPPERLLRQGEHTFGRRSSPADRLVFSVEEGRATALTIEGAGGWLERGARIEQRDP